VIGLILAAGRGSRISSLTDGLPKSFLRLQGKRLIDHQIDLMSSAPEIADIVIVAGYRSDLLMSEYGDVATVVVNPFFDRTNVLASVWFARGFMDDGFLFAHADTYVAPTIFNRLIEDERDAVLACEVREPLVPEEMKVVLEGERIRKISKRLPPEECQGEFIGLAKFAGDAAKKVGRLVSLNIEDQGNHDDYFEKVVQDYIDAGASVWSLDIEDDFAIEIDFPEDYSRAKARLEERSDRDRK
jgi:choline kinase